MLANMLPDVLAYILVGGEMRNLKIWRLLSHDDLVLIVNLVSLTDKFTVSLTWLSDLLHHDVWLTRLAHNDQLLIVVLVSSILLISLYLLQSELGLLRLVGEMHMNLVHVCFCVAKIISRLLTCRGRYPCLLLIGS